MFKAGLPYFDAEFNFSDLTDDKISKIIEDESPKYTPGTKTEYHPITFGWLIDEVVEIFNSPEIRSASQPAISGVGTARGLARTFELFMDGVLVSKSLLQRISKPQFENVFDHGLGKEESKGYGFVYTKSSMASRSNSWQIGHPAIGGQRVYMDPADRLVVCYLTNGVKSWEGDNPTTFENLQLEVYSTLKRQHSCSAENIDRALQGKLP
ncbi:unnamed protein product [Heligmosomoides polygyrus]|uniref:Beta-lactamase domain-containing protein n=1 Tax=Heligmosomoides polygyrus TaxID=6339 RepID=A0A183G043_HELPZ|nr:unnamed protein product [Heligmosomoides polygyrus]